MHEEAPEAENLPRAHAEHKADPLTLEKWPPTHSEQEEISPRPSWLLFVPARQWEHTVAPSSAYLPAPHAAHSANPAEAECLPAEHWMHPVWFSSVISPAWHFQHVEEPALEYWPFMQLLQDAARLLPEKFPATHSTQADTFTWPAEGLALPAWQAVQAVAPDKE